MEWYFVLDIDRDFMTRRYGNGRRLYTNMLEKSEGQKYFIIAKSNYIEGTEKNDESLEIETNCGKKLTLKEKPNNEIFENSIYKAWEAWDKEYGSYEEENRCDFKPIAFKSLKGIHLNNYTIE